VLVLIIDLWAKSVGKGSDEVGFVSPFCENVEKPVFCSGFRDMSSLLNLLKKKQNSH
jgi:hypothetical protein